MTLYPIALHWSTKHVYNRSLQLFLNYHSTQFVMALPVSILVEERFFSPFPFYLFTIRAQSTGKLLAPNTRQSDIEEQTCQMSVKKNQTIELLTATHPPAKWYYNTGMNVIWYLLTSILSIWDNVFGVNVGRSSFALYVRWLWCFLFEYWRRWGLLPWRRTFAHRGSVSIVDRVIVIICAVIAFVVLQWLAAVVGVIVSLRLIFTVASRLVFFFRVSVVPVWVACDDDAVGKWMLDVETAVWSNRKAHIWRGREKVYVKAIEQLKRMREIECLVWGSSFSLCNFFVILCTNSLWCEHSEQGASKSCVAQFHSTKCELSATIYASIAHGEPYCERRKDWMRTICVNGVCVRLVEATEFSFDGNWIMKWTRFNEVKAKVEWSAMLSGHSIGKESVDEGGERMGMAHRMTMGMQTVELSCASTWWAMHDDWQSIRITKRWWANQQHLILSTICHPAFSIKHTANTYYSIKLIICRLRYSTCREAHCIVAAIMAHASWTQISRVVQSPIQWRATF